MDAPSLTVNAPTAWIWALGAGLLSFFSPCTLPLLPAYLSYLTGIERYDELVAAKSRRHILPHALMFILGFSTVFVLLGATASALGSFVNEYARSFELVGGVVMTLFGLGMIGWLRVPVLYRDVHVRLKSRPAGFVGSFLIGTVFAAGWSPCVGPILAVILAIASQSQRVSEGMFFLSVYSLGLAVPFLLCSLVLEEFMGWIRKRGHWLVRLEAAAGLLLIVVGVAMLTGQWAKLMALSITFSYTPRL